MIIGRVKLVKFAKAFYRNTSFFPRLSKTEENKVSEISLTDTELMSLLFPNHFAEWNIRKTEGIQSYSFLKIVSSVMITFDMTLLNSNRYNPCSKPYFYFSTFEAQFLVKASFKTQ